MDALVSTIFHEPWWLEIATNGRYQLAEVSENGRVMGRLPYFLHRHMGLVRSDMPPLTHFLGPSVVEDEGPWNARFARRQAITHELIRKLPDIPMFYIKCHRGITDVIAFQGEGFRSSVQFTHEIHPQPAATIWDNMQSKRRSAITRAQKELSCEVIRDPSEFMRFNEENLKAYGLKSHYDLGIFRKLVESCLERKQGRVLTAKDEKGAFVAATFCVWDQTSYYFLMGTRKPNASRGALSLLAWEAIRDAMQKNLIFDLDGLSNEGTASFYSGFGASIAPRYIVARETFVGKVIIATRSLCKKGSFFY